MLRIALPIALTISIAPLAWSEAGTEAGDSPPPSLAVTGNGEVWADPDEAIVRLGATAQAPTARAAQAEVNRIAGAVRSALAAAGVAEERLQTSELSLHPVYAHPGPRDAPDQEPRIVGYRASNVVSVRLSEMERVAAVIDAGLGAGANRLEGLSFTLADDRGARQEALRRAVRAAQEKAQAIAGALGVDLGPVLEASEGSMAVQPPPYGLQRMAMAAEGAMPATPVESGQVQVRAEVSVRYRIEP